MNETGGQEEGKQEANAPEKAYGHASYGTKGLKIKTGRSGESDDTSSPRMSPGGTMRKAPKSRGSTGTAGHQSHKEKSVSPLS